MSTAEELWNDIDFIEKRVIAQEEHLVDIRQRYISTERKAELYDSALHQWNVFITRYYELIDKPSN